MSFRLLIRKKTRTGAYGAPWTPCSDRGCSSASVTLAYPASVGASRSSYFSDAIGHVHTKIFKASTHVENAMEDMFNFEDLTVLAKAGVWTCFTGCVRVSRLRTRVPVSLVVCEFQ
jgi:hypothetical protein